MSYFDKDIILNSLIHQRICNDDDCPLKKVHQLPITQRLEWKNKLTWEEIEEIVAHYHACIHKLDDKLQK